MIGQMRKFNYQKYMKSCKITGEPTEQNLPIPKLDLRGILHYAREKGVKVHQLSEQEKKQFYL